MKRSFDSSGNKHKKWNEKNYVKLKWWYEHELNRFSPNKHWMACVYCCNTSSTHDHRHHHPDHQSMLIWNFVHASHFVTWKPSRETRQKYLIYFDRLWRWDILVRTSKATVKIEKDRNICLFACNLLKQSVHYFVFLFVPRSLFIWRKKKKKKMEYIYTVSNLILSYFVFAFIFCLSVPTLCSFRAHRHI